ncbi:MAG: cation-translocating P-type ATPase [Propionicimonas sp.]
MNSNGSDRGLSFGLTSEEVLAQRAQFGENRLPTKDAVSAWSILWSQFTSPLIYIILAAAGISLTLGEYGDFAIIMAVVVVDVVLGFVQEFQAQRAFVALKGLLKPTATVIRDGVRREIEVWQLVPQDVAVLAVGDRVPGDGDLLEATRLALDEAILTGESEPVSKVAAGGKPAAGATPEADQDARQTRVFMGATVVTGRGTMRVTATGAGTELGQIATSLTEQDEEETPLQARLKAFSKVLTWVVVTATAVILVVGLMLGRGFFDMLRTAIILAIAAVPEGLIIAVTVILVLGMRRILKRQGLVKRLLAVETLGSVTVICTDKTGTLTQGRMRVHRADLADTERAWQAMVLCNNLEGSIDIALWEYAEQQLPGRPQELVDGSVRLAEELFTSETKYMIAAVTSTVFAGEKYYFLKGAPEIVVGMCTVDAGEQERVLAEIDEWAADGLRLLGLAYRHDGALEDYDGYTWVGLVGMEDPVRPGVSEAVKLAHRAGIRTTMITGDYRRTAESIATSIGLPVSGPAVEGKAVAAMSDEQLRHQVRITSVFARIRPQDKLRIIRALQANGDITAMIGDGVNDAPALLHANIGVVVGSATDVAKESADLILLDNNYATVVAAVEEGRVIFDNIRKVVAYVLSNSFAEVLAIFGAMMLGWPAPLLVAQILWIHLICDGPSDIVLGFEPKEDGIMDAKPRSLKEPVLDRLGSTLIGVISISSAVFALVLFGHFHLTLNDPVEGRSIVFASFAINSMVYIFAYRSLRTPLHRMNPITANQPLIWAVAAGILTAVLPFWIPSLGDLLGIVPLSWMEWSWVAGFAILLLGVVELAKAISNRAAPGQGGLTDAS